MILNTPIKKNIPFWVILFLNFLVILGILYIQVSYDVFYFTPQLVEKFGTPESCKLYQECMMSKKLKKSVDDCTKPIEFCEQYFIYSGSFVSAEEKAASNLKFFIAYIVYQSVIIICGIVMLLIGLNKKVIKRNLYLFCINVLILVLSVLFFQIEYYILTPLLDF